MSIVSNFLHKLIHTEENTKRKQSSTETVALSTLQIPDFFDFNKLSLNELCLFARVLNAATPLKKDCEKLGKALQRQSPTLVARVERCVPIYFPNKLKEKEAAIRSKLPQRPKPQEENQKENKEEPLLLPLSTRSDTHGKKTVEIHYPEEVIQTPMSVIDIHNAQKTELQKALLSTFRNKDLVFDFVETLSHLTQPIASHTWDERSMTLTIRRDESAPTNTEMEINGVGTATTTIPQTISFTLSSADTEHIQASSPDCKIKVKSFTFSSISIRSSLEGGNTKSIFCISYAKDSLPKRTLINASIDGVISLLETEKQVRAREICDTKKSEIRLASQMLYTSFEPEYHPNDIRTISVTLPARTVTKEVDDEEAEETVQAPVEHKKTQELSREEKALAVLTDPSKEFRFELSEGKKRYKIKRTAGEGIFASNLDRHLGAKKHSVSATVQHDTVIFSFDAGKKSVSISLDDFLNATNSRDVL